MYLRRVVDIPHRRPASHADRSCLWVYTNASHRRKVDDQSAVARAEPRNVMTAPADGKREVVFTGKLHCGDHIGWALALDNNCGPPINHPVPNVPCLLVAGIPWHDDSPFDS